MTNFTPRFLDDIRARLTLSELVGRRVKLVRSGREYKACCPFHKEKTPSFYVNDDKQFFHCFGCGANGDAIGFTMRYDNLSFPDAVERLAAEAGLQMPVFSPEDSARAASQKTLYSMLDQTAQWFQDQLILPKNRDAYDYVIERSLTPDTISNFKLGFAPDDDMAMIRHLIHHGFTEDQMVEAGLIKYREQTNAPYAFFRDRVMFPVTDRTGRVIAFGGRAMPDALRPLRNPKFKPPKYLNSPETSLFQKGKMVYALSHARTAASSQKPLIIVEGYMDVIACHQAGFTGAVAPLGTALTPDQILLLWKIMPGPDHMITLCFDGDNAGRTAAIRAADRLLPLIKPDHSARIAFLPDGDDPDTLIVKKGASAFQLVIDRAVPLAEFLFDVQVQTRRLHTPEDRAGLEADIDRIVAQIMDPKTKYHYQSFFRSKMRDKLRELSGRSGGPAGQNRPFYSGKSSPTSGASRSFTTAPSARPITRAGTAQKKGADVLLATLINHPSIFDQVDEKIGLLTLDDPTQNSLRDTLLDILSAPSHEPKSMPLTRLDIIESILKIAPQHSEIIQYLMSDTVMARAAFARPTANDDDARVGFEEVFANISRKI